MAIALDHLIVRVRSLDDSVAFYRDILGLAVEGRRDPFTILRVTPELTLQLAPFGTEGGDHLAFALPQAEFAAAFRRVREAGIPYGDAFDAVGNMRGPGDEAGARGPGKAVYFFDPNRHLIEIRTYGDA